MKNIFRIIILVLYFTLPLIIFSQIHVYPSQNKQHETSLAVNPTNPLNIIGVAIITVNVEHGQEKYIGVYYGLAVKDDLVVAVGQEIRGFVGGPASILIGRRN